MPVDRDGTKLQQLMLPLYVELLRVSWADAERQGLVEGSFDLENEYVQEVLDQLATRIKGITETSMQDVQQLIGRQSEEGWSVDQLAEALQEKFTEWTTTRTEMIAVTETAAAYSLGSMAAWRDTGQVTGKEWMTADDEVCDICQELNGMVVGLDEEFAPGIASPGAHPRCRCTLLPVLGEAS